MVNMSCNCSSLSCSTTHYNAPVRMGNWFEDMCQKEEELQASKQRHKIRELLVEKARKLYDILFKEIKLHPPTKSIEFNSVYQIGPIQMLLSNMDTSRLSPLLSIVVSDKVVLKGRSLNEDCEVTVGHSDKSIARNTFKIVKCENDTYMDNRLKYGQKFRIESVTSEENPMYLYSAAKISNLALPIASSCNTKVHGEVTLPLGLIKKNHCGPGFKVSLAYTYWFCVHVDPSRRYETKGEEVLCNEPVVIVHMVTNRNLAVENVYVDTLFGPEFLVCIQNYRDAIKRETWKNVWMISNGQQRNIISKK